MPIGDLHTLHPVVPTYQILSCIAWALPDDAQTAAIDVLYINGDFFERIQSFNSPDVHLVISYVRHLLKMCKRMNIKVRVLEGTPSHDWKQNIIFQTLNDDDPLTGDKGIGADLKYVDQIHIEYMEDHDMHVLYIPDLKIDASQIWKTVVDKMRILGIDKVDYTCVHGAFKFQVPPVMHSSPHIHDADAYADITRYHVFTSHIHTPSVYRNIIGCGSLECLRHGEEHDKGYVRSWVTPELIDHQFIVNPIKTQFKKLDMVGYTKRQVLDLINGTLEYTDRLACLKIIANKADEVYQMSDKLNKLYPNVKFTYDVPDRKKKDAFNPTEEENLPHLSKVTLTRDNLKDELYDRVSKELPQHSNRISSILDEVIKE